MQTVESKIREYLLNSCAIDTDFGIDDDLEMMGLDSLDDIEFIMWAEEEFNVNISDSYAEGWESLRDVVTWIERKV